MEANENGESRETHQTVVRLVTGIFKGPYISYGLISFLALVILTDYAYVLLREPPLYWLDYSREMIRSIGGFQYGPVVALGIHLIYIILLSAVLSLLNRQISIILWSGMLLVHLSAFILVPPSCRSDLAKVLPAWLCSWNLDILTFVIGSIIGLVLSGNLYVSKNQSSELGYRRTLVSRLGFSRLSMTSSIAWLLILGIGIGLAARTPTTGWLPLSTDQAPSPRYETMVAYDVGHQEAILFGGTVEASANNWTKTNDTWKWDGQDWTQLSPQQSPPARARGAMAYDSKRQVIILFGGWDNLGKSLNDTWIWDGSNWIQAENCNTCYPPPSRGCHNMYYDSVREQVVLYGGCNEFQVFYNDAWGWNGKVWERIDMRDSPVASGAPIVYDSNEQSAIGFLAWQPSGTWTWDKNGWSKPTLTTEPPLRGNSMMAYDPTTGNSLMFGGTKTENNALTLYLDTWVIHEETWREVKSSLTPPGRWGHVLFFDSTLQKFVLFGGHDGKTALNDLWEISVPSD